MKANWIPTNKKPCWQIIAQCTQQLYVRESGAVTCFHDMLTYMKQLKLLFTSQMGNVFLPRFGRALCLLAKIKLLLQIMS